jgi:hypothetical protein
VLCYKMRFCAARGGVYYKRAIAPLGWWAGFQILERFFAGEDNSWTTPSAFVTAFLAGRAKNTGFTGSYFCP